MLTEDCIVLNPNDVMRIFWIMLFEVGKNVELNTCLVMKALLVPNDLYSDQLACLVIVAFDSLAKTTLAQRFLYLIPIAEMILHYNLIVTSVIIKTLVVWY